MSENNKFSLTKLQQDEVGIVDGLRGGHAFQQKLNSMGIRPGKKITKISNMMMNGPVTVKVDNSSIAIGRGMADRIIVKRVKEG